MKRFIHLNYQKIHLNFSQLEILLDDSIKEAYLCPTNPEQGPLMHMPVINNPNAFTNQVVAQFYGKDFVITVQE